jgi:peptidoglycan/LPS O-acetylase OafA/YrhL
LTAATAPESTAGTGFRPDIEGLRAVAVVLIVLYHAGVGVLGGGYVGVDVFFVISGFLITGLLVRELEDTGRLDLVGFYARRARRILPAALLVLGAIVLGYLVLLSPVALWRAAPDIAAAAAYVPNFRFAFAHTDYFHPARVSPVIHYWSLGVEEQFYAVWPAFLWLAYRAVRGSRNALTWLVAAAVAASFVLSLVGTAAYPTATFYLLPTRAWELGAGALVALVGARAGRLGAGLANAAGIAGLLLIGLSAVVLRETTPFPGLAGLLPVGGATLVVVAGLGRQPTLAASALSWAPVRWLGRISYSLYLWHWPMGIFAGAVLVAAPPPVQAAAGVAASVVLAAATYRWVEDPLRRGRFIGLRPAWNLAAAVIGSAVIALGSLELGHLAVAPFRQGRAAPPPTTVDPLAGLLPAVGPTQDGPLPRPLIPPLLHIHRASVAINPNANRRCSLLAGDTVNGPCRFGDPSGATDVVLLGDSHLGQWWPALERIATARHWRITFLLKTSCPYEDRPATAPWPRGECETWRDGALRRIAAERPDLVLLASNHRAPATVGGVPVAGETAIQVMRAGAEQTISAIRATGAPVVVIADTPRVPFDPAECLSRNAAHVLACAVPRDHALDLPWVEAEPAAARAAGAVFVDANAWACSSDPCPMILGHYIVFADTNHLTPAFVQALTSRLDAAIPR